MNKTNKIYQCQISNCGYIYIPDKGDKRSKILPGTHYEDLPDEWKCPSCGASKNKFKIWNSN